MFNLRGENKRRLKYHIFGNSPRLVLICVTERLPLPLNALQLNAVFTSWLQIWTGNSNGNVTFVRIARKREFPCCQQLKLLNGWQFQNVTNTSEWIFHSSNAGSGPFLEGKHTPQPHTGNTDMRFMLSGVEFGCVRVSCDGHATCPRCVLASSILLL